MPDVKFYCPEEKSHIIPVFRTKYGKDWGRHIIELMEGDTEKNPTASKTDLTETIYKRVFGDIENENEFISDFGQNSCITAVKNRLDTVFSKYRDNYPEIVELVRIRLPKISKLGEI